MTATVVIVLLLCALVVYGVISYRKTLRSGCCGSGDDTQAERILPRDANASAYRYVCSLEIEGMHCAHCAQRIENAFNSRDGFMARVSLDKHRAEVRCREEPEEGLLRQIVAVAGYHVTDIKKA